uniref:RRM domain-containing protein n=1 Tax=Syphacia muris TaxID=451379 RepID=A0A0N5AXV6_9BILA
MSLADLSLDDIIARQGKKKGGARRNVVGSNSVKQRGRGFTRKYSATDATFTKDVPDGRWGHDGFEELYGGGLKRTAKVRAIRIGSKNFSRSALDRKVKLHITNLPATVNTADLDELFEKYQIESATVNYDELGQSVGTADVVTDRASAEEIKSNFAGAKLDGMHITYYFFESQIMRMFIIDESAEDVVTRSIKDRLSLGKRPARVTRGIMKRKETRLYRKPIGANRRLKNRKVEDKRKKMTDAELDKELEEYMKKGSSNAMESEHS